MTYRVGLAHEPDNEELKDELRRALDKHDRNPMDDEAEARVARMAADPEIVAILSDPVIIQQMLCEGSSSPGLDAACLKIAGVAAAKVQKLVDAGLIAP